jgi:hypothetical protein
MSQIIPIIKKDRELSKEEATFNNLLLKIEAAKESYVKTKALLESKREFAEANLRPIIDNQVEVRIKLFSVFWGTFNERKAHKKDEIFILYLFNEFKLIKTWGENLTEKDHGYLNNIFDELRILYAGESKDEEDEEEEGEFDQEEFEEFLADFKFQQLQQGYDVDISNLNGFMSEEELNAELIHRLNQAKQKAHFEGTGPRKSKKELKKEAEQKEIEEAKKKNVSTIFKNLAKQVHPDLEQDETERLKKEEFMKKVNQAYNDHDLFTLLSLEQELIVDSSDRLNELTEAQIKIYIKVLREQLDELKNEEARLLYEPKYNFIRKFVDNAYTLRIWNPEKQIKLCTNDLKKLEETLREVSSPKKERNFFIRNKIFDFSFEMRLGMYRSW